jgi:hypothetical protein
MLQRIDLTILLRGIVALVFPFRIVAGTQAGAVSPGYARVVRELGRQLTLSPWC